jgi:hypothetical protein
MKIHYSAKKKAINWGITGDEKKSHRRDAPFGGFFICIRHQGSGNTNES